MQEEAEIRQMGGVQGSGPGFCAEPGRTSNITCDSTGKEDRAPGTWCRGLVYIQLDFLKDFFNYLEQKKNPDTDSLSVYILI